MGIRQREFLVREFPYDTARFGKLGDIEAPDCQAWQRINEREELRSPALIITAKEPTMAFGDDQRRSDHWRRLGKQPPEQRVEAVGLVQESDES